MMASRSLLQLPLFLWRRLQSTTSTTSPPLMKQQQSEVSKAVKGEDVALFEEERQRQLVAAGQRLEKIRVITSLDPDGELLMNKDISTPLDCARHLRQSLEDTAVLAVVDGDKPWDMRRPLEGDCSLEFLVMKTKHDPMLANLTFWRTGSVMLGALLKTAFKSPIQVDLCSFPPPNPDSGSFLYDVRISNLPHSNWLPTSTELRALSVIGQRLAWDNLPIDRISIGLPLANQMFANSPIKLSQLDSIAATSSGIANRVMVYRLGNHLEVSKGPLLGNTGLFGRFSVAGWHYIDTPDYGRLVRIQGVGMPTEFMTHAATWDVVMRRAAKYNHSRHPQLVQPK